MSNISRKIQQAADPRLMIARTPTDPNAELAAMQGPQDAQEEAADFEKTGGWTKRDTLIGAGALAAVGIIVAGAHSNHNVSSQENAKPTVVNHDTQPNNRGIETDPVTGESSITITSPVVTTSSEVAPTPLNELPNGAVITNAIGQPEMIINDPQLDPSFQGKYDPQTPVKGLQPSNPQE